MDNKITKKRLSSFLSYEWILIIVLSVAAVLLVNIIYSATRVKLTVGQKFRIFYDYSISANASAVNSHLDKKDALSFDVLEFTYENLLADSDVLTTRLEVYEGDLIITDAKEPSDQSSNQRVLAKTRVDGDSASMYTYDGLLKDARAYLLSMKKAGVTITADGKEDIKYEDLDPKKIEQGFYDRLGKDNRFRKAEQKQEGIRLEKQRIKKLCDEVNDFKKLLELSNDYFFCYTKYDQKIKIAEKNGDESTLKTYQSAYDNEFKYRKNAKYGLRLDKINEIKDGNTTKKDITEFVSLSNASETTAKDIVIMVYNFKSKQPALQFETISVINSLVRECSTILD